MERYPAAQRIFLFFAVIIGLFMVFFIPPFQSQDEPNHFKRAYSVAVFKNFSIQKDSKLGNFLPSSIQNFINAASDTGQEVTYGHSGYKYSLDKAKKLLNYEINKNDQAFLNYPNMAIYSPAAYLPQSTGIFLAGLFTQKVLLLFLAGRIFNMLFYTLLCFYAIKTTPFLNLKWISVLVLCCPMSLALASSMSADAVLISCCALFFAKILQYAFSKEDYLTSKQICLLALLALVIALCKQSIFFLLFIFLIPPEKIKCKYPVFLLITLLPAIIFSAFWSGYAVSVMVSLNGSDALSHAVFVLQHPLSFILLVLKTVFSTEILCQSIGVLAWKDLWLNPFFYAVYVIVTALNLLSLESEKAIVSPWQKITACLTIMINILVISLLSFMYWTYRSNFNYIEMQGRYLLPFAVPFWFLLYSFVKTGIKKFNIPALNTIFLCVTGVYLFFKILSVYY